MDRPEPALHVAWRLENRFSDCEGIMNTAQPVLNAPSIGQHNHDVMDSLTRAKRVAVWLSRAGYTVNQIIVTSRNARVLVRHHPRLIRLLDAVAIIQTKFDTTMAANVEGVQVEWVIRRSL